MRMGASVTKRPGAGLTGIWEGAEAVDWSGVFSGAEVCGSGMRGEMFVMQGSLQSFQARF
jgi:hypothetical protein